MTSCPVLGSDTRHLPAQEAKTGPCSPPTGDQCWRFRVDKNTRRDDLSKIEVLMSLGNTLCLARDFDSGLPMLERALEPN
jgi:hypothetical protein